jgi:hypothetical protein
LLVLVAAGGLFSAAPGEHGQTSGVMGTTLFL